MAASAAAAFLLAVLLQHLSVWAALRAAVLGYAPARPELAAILSGGGLVSMQELLRQRLPECDFLTEEIGAVLGVHLGIGGVGVFFFNEM